MVALDIALTQITPEQLQQLEEMKASSSAAEIAAWFSELGLNVSQKEITAWQGAITSAAGTSTVAESLPTVPPASGAVVSRKRPSRTPSFEKMDADKALAKVQGLSLRLISELVEQCDRAETGSQDSLKILSLLPGLMRECRSAAAQKNEAKYIKDKRALQLAGAQRVCDILTLTFKDTPYTEGVAEALKGAMLQIEGEI